MSIKPTLALINHLQTIINLDLQKDFETFVQQHYKAYKNFKGKILQSGIHLHGPIQRDEQTIMICCSVLEVEGEIDLKTSPPFLETGLHFEKVLLQKIQEEAYRSLRHANSAFSLLKIEDTKKPPYSVLSRSLSKIRDLLISTDFRLNACKQTQAQLKVTVKTHA